MKTDDEIKRLDKRIDSMRELYDELLCRVSELEFKANNHPKFVVGGIYYGWKVADIKCKSDIRKIGITPYMISWGYHYVYNCMNCEENKIATFTEDELINLGKK